MKQSMIIDLLSTQFVADPHLTLKAVQGTNTPLQDNHTNAYLILHHSHVTQVLRSSDFTTAPLASRAQPVMGERVLAQMEGCEHHGKRKAILSQLTGRLFREQYAHSIRHIIHEVLGPLLPKGSVDLIKEFGSPYSIRVTLAVLGLPVDRHEDVARWHRGIAAYVTSLKMTEAECQFSLFCSQQLIAYLTPLVEQEMCGSGTSFIATLHHSTADDHPMTTSELVALVLNILLAATEPADKTLAYLFYHLLSSPPLFARVEQDRTLLSSAIDETLRLTSPVQLIPRQAADNVQVGDMVIPKNALVFCMIGAANRDPLVFENPDAFQIDRRCKGRPSGKKIPPHLAFGSGPHVCVGAAFSSMQITLTANVIMDRLKDLHLSPGFLLHEEGLYTRGPSSMLVHFRACSQSDTALEPEA